MLTISANNKQESVGGAKVPVYLNPVDWVDTLTYQLINELRFVLEVRWVDPRPRAPVHGVVRLPLVGQDCVAAAALEIQGPRAL